MAIILLLAAPKENRTANPNAQALIHEVRGGSWEVLKSAELREYADQIDMEQNAILDIYAERTGHDRVELENLMKEEKFRTATELLNYGFISKINTYNTNLKPKNQMSKPTMKVQDLINKASTMLGKIANLLDGQEPVNYEFKDSEDVVLFTTEKEDDSLAVGDPATPDGTFTITDGRTVIIADGLITEIKEVETENTAEAVDSVEVETLQNEIQELRNSLTEAKEVINDLKNQVQTNFVAGVRQNAATKSNVKTEEELRNETREKRAKMKGTK